MMHKCNSTWLNIFLVGWLMLSSVSTWAQKDNVLEEVLLQAYQSQDSSAFYFKKAKAMLKKRGDSASYFYFKFYSHKDNYKSDSASYYASKVIPIYKQFDSLNRLRKIYEALHYNGLYGGNYEKALENAQKALTVAETMKDTSMITLHYADISNVYHDFEDYEKGIAVGKEGARLMKSASTINYKYLIFVNNTIAINFDDWGKGDSALYYHYKNLDYLKYVEDSLRFGFVFNNIGNTLLKNKRFTEAKKIINRSLAINKLGGRDYNLATNYTNLATIAYETNRYEEAKELFVLANEYALRSGTIEKIRDVTQQEAWFYKKIGNFEKALERQEAFYKFRDSVFNVERAEKVAEMEARYETEKKGKELAKTRANLAETELKVEQRNNVIYGSLGLAAILGLLGYLFFSRQRLKNRQLKKEAELSEALARIETQNRLQEQRLRISRDLHDNIGSQLTFVTSSVDNLKFGLKDENSVVNDKLEKISAFTTQTIFELRDTIWAMNKNDISFEDIQSRIANFIERARASYPAIDFQFKIHSEVSGKETFSSIQGMNMYRIIQEAINNALKYAKASEIKVEVGANHLEQTILITDNGDGFDLNQITRGNGLTNIEKRARDLGGKALIESEIDKGTRITVKFPKTE